MNLVAEWGPAVFMVFAIWMGLLYNNKRLDDFKDLLKAVVSDPENRLRTEIASVRTEMVASEARIRADIAKLDTRIVHLEEPRVVR